MKRSTRNITISKAFKHIDSDTRKDLKDRRLLGLEADNFGDAEPTETIDDDDFDGGEVSEIQCLNCIFTMIDWKL